MTYLKQGLSELNHLRHLVLLDGNSRRMWTEEQLKYYATHLGPGGRADDWLFDPFLFMNSKSGSGRDYVAEVNLGQTGSVEGNFAGVCSPNPADKSDWSELLGFYFGENGALPTLDRAIQKLSGQLPPPDHRRNVVLSLPYPHITQERFGRIEAAGNVLNFSVRRQDLTRATNSRLEAEKWMVDEIVELWSKARYGHLNLLGLHWVFETVCMSWEVDDHRLLEGLRKHINARKLKFIWIPSSTAYNIHLLDNYEMYYFDAAFLRPNLLFREEGNKIETVAEVARKCNAGIGMEYCLEPDESIAVGKERHLRFREYLNAGVKCGYMTESACAHYQSLPSFERMYLNEDPVEREFYGDIYKFVEGKYELKTLPPIPANSFFVPKRKAVIALDLGGTNLRMAVVDDAGKIVHWSQDRTPVSSQGIVDLTAEEVGEGIKLAGSNGFVVTGIGMSTGGRVNFKNGTIGDSTSAIAGWKNIHIKQILEERFGIPAVVDNDGNCSAIAKKIFGKAKSADNFISVVLGTGIGGGIYVDGKLLRAKNNYTAEIGHISVDPDGPRCSCGGYGCIELYASGAGLVRWAEEESKLTAIVGIDGEHSSKAISEASTPDNPAAIELLRKAGGKLGAAVAGLVNIFNPSMIVFSGSLVNLGAPYFDSFRETLLNRGMKPTVDDVEILFSDFPQEVGIMGAAALAFQISADREF